MQRNRDTNMLLTPAKMILDAHSSPGKSNGQRVAGGLTHHDYNTRVNSNRIRAIDHVRLEAPCGIEAALRWFYGDIGGLEPASSELEVVGRLCFKSGRLELLIDLLERPRIDPVATRLTILVPSLEEAAAVLDEHSVRYQRISGVMFTDRRLAMLDPAGNRVELKQEWPYAPI